MKLEITMEERIALYDAIQRGKQSIKDMLKYQPYKDTPEHKRLEQTYLGRLQTLEEFEEKMYQE